MTEEQQQHHEHTHQQQEHQHHEHPQAKRHGNRTLMYIGIPVAIVVVIAGIYFGLGGIAPSTVAAGDNVSVYYTGTLANGTVFGTNIGGALLNFTAGSNEVIPGFSDAVIGMRIGQNRTFSLPPQEAYGYVNQSLIVAVPRSQFGNLTPENGMVVSTSFGQEAKILSFNTTNVVLDFNPPLAGQTLIFQVRVVNIRG